MCNQLMYLSCICFGWDCSCLSNPSGHWAGSAAQPLTLQPLCQRQQLPALEHGHPRYSPASPRARKLDEEQTFKAQVGPEISG